LGTDSLNGCILSFASLVLMWKRYGRIGADWLVLLMGETFMSMFGALGGNWSRIPEGLEATEATRKKYDVYYE